MSSFKILYPLGATPLDPNELNGLLPTYITTQGELNELESENILEATRWALSKNTHDCLTISFCLELHKRMFSSVWKWAGKIRLSDKNIGVSKELIYPNLKELFDDTHFWMKNTTYPFDEIGARFHHRLVSIHPFANGNGRHARLLTDVLLIVNDKQIFSWGNSDAYHSPSEARAAYLNALRAADTSNYAPLTHFVRS